MGYLQEIGYLATLENPCKVHDKNYNQIDAKPKIAMIYAPSPPRKEIKDANLSPTTYDIEGSFKKSQLGKFTSFSIGKEKKETQIVDFKLRTSHLS